MMPLLRALHTKEINSFNRRRGDKEIWITTHESLGNRPIQVFLTPGLVCECVEDTIHSRFKLESAPQHCGWFLVRKFESFLKKGFDVLFFSRFRLKAGK